MPDTFAIPAFFDTPAPPTDDVIWGQLTKAPADSVVVFDDLTVLGNAYPTLLGKLQLFGYVATGHGGVAKDSVLAQASSWVGAFPNLSGFFLDEGPDENATEEVFDYYFDLYETIRVLGRTIMLNCAGVRDQRVLTPAGGKGPACDLAVLVEKQYSSYISSWWTGASSPWWTEADLRDRIVHTLHTCPSLGDMAIAMKLCRARNARYLYIFDGTSAGYNRLPRYWDEELLSLTDADACQPIEDLIAGISDDITSLQSEIATATSGEKSALLHLIRHLEVTRARAAKDLTACRALP